MTTFLVVLCGTIVFFAAWWVIGLAYLTATLDRKNKPDRWFDWVFLGGIILVAYLAEILSPSFKK